MSLNTPLSGPMSGSRVQSSVERTENTLLTMAFINIPFYCCESALSRRMQKEKKSSLHSAHSAENGLTLTQVVNPKKNHVNKSEYLSVIAKMKSGDMILHRALSWDDIQRLKGFDSIYETNQGKLLARSNGTFILLEPCNSSGLIPEEAIFVAPYANPVSLSNGVSFKRRIGTMLSRCGRKNTLFAALSAALLEPLGRREELSVELSEFIWQQNQDAIQVQFRSSKAGLPSPGQLKVVFGNTERVSSAEFCLAACVDGTVKWLRETECNEEGHIWTMHLFDRHIGEPTRFSQRLKRNRPISSCNNCGNHIGNNVNHCGIQIIGDVSSIQRL